MDVNYEIKHFSTANRMTDREEDLGEWYEEYVRAPLLVKMDEFQEKDSGWALSAIINLAVNMDPVRRSSYIPLPQQIAAKKQ